MQLEAIVFQQPSEERMDWKSDTSQQVGNEVIEAKVSRSFDEMITIDLVETTLTIRLQTCTTLRLSNR